MVKTNIVKKPEQIVKQFNDACEVLNWARMDTMAQALLY